MKPERWQQISTVFQAALERGPGRQAAFLDEACAGDSSLRREVESLIASHEQVGNFIEGPAIEVAAPLLVDDQADSVGRVIGHYKILGPLGEGGMGEVYLAQDTKLRRQIAIKLLPTYLTQNKDRLRRFEQEAQSASTLSHPNVCVIHEIGETEDGRHFITMEYVDGVTLRQHMTAAQMKLGEVLDVAIQSAAALAAAHAAGIVHRDIKPENIMIRGDGYVKVLDFGLAKLTERTTVDTEAATRMVKTNPGVVMGTVAFMSPEQARGLPVDERTDIWSLGVVLYEMATGRVPFEGETATDVILSVVEREPPPLARYSKEVPAELERIVNKALRKNRDERYQTVKDLSLDLKSLKQELEKFGVRPSGGWSTDAKTARPEGGTPNTSLGTSITHPGAPITHPASSAEYIISEIKSHKRSVVVALVALLMAVGAAGYYFYFAKAGEAIDSVAVMPFVNVSGDPNTEYLSDGISESIINNLSQLPSLKKVIALNSVLRYKGKQTDPQAVGRELNVRAVLMGRLIQRGDDLSISVELVDARDNKLLWGGQFNRKQADIIGLQTEIAQNISEGLRLRLSGGEKKRLAKRYTESGEAYQLYMMGRYYSRTRSEEGLQKSIELLELAIKKDPNYAPAYAGLAQTYSLLGYTGLLPPKETRQKEEWAALKALEIDNDLAEAHAALAHLRALDLNWLASGEESKRALELNPNSVEVQTIYADHLVVLGRLDEALLHLKQAQELDPLSLITGTLIGWVTYLSRQYDLAIEQFQKTIKMDPNFGPAHNRLAWAYLAKGMYEEAITEQKKAIALDDRPVRNAALGNAYAAAGKRDEAQRIFDELKELSKQPKQRYVSPFNFALIYIGLGDKDQAFVWLEKSCEEHSDRLQYIKTDPRFDSLRSDARFADLLRCMKLGP